MTQAVLARWLKSPGDPVSPGDVIAEMESDKALVELQSEFGGLLQRRLVEEGTTVVVGQIVAMIQPADGPTIRDDSVAPSETNSPMPGRFEPAAPADASAAPAGAVRSALPLRLKGRPASPVARRLASQHGVSLASVAGSGPRGRIVRADIERAVKANSAAGPKPATHHSPITPNPSDGVTRIPHSTMRKAIARRLSEAKRDIPHFYVQCDCELDRLLALRAEINARGSGNLKLSTNDFVLRAAALALRQHMSLNAMWTDEAMLQFDNVDISVAVATPTGLLTPIIRQADRKSLATLSREMKHLAERARGGGLRPDEHQGGTFTISNLGMYGATAFAAIINPPQACILAIGAVLERPIVRAGQCVAAQIMTATISADHRIVDGAAAAAFLATFKSFLQAPLSLLI
jgi:pyruvate dehydrogenase E2 component (dihydrolipoamide acetyltransferase)